MGKMKNLSDTLTGFAKFFQLSAGIGLITAVLKEQHSVVYAIYGSLGVYCFIDAFNYYLGFIVDTDSSKEKDFDNLVESHKNLEGFVKKQYEISKSKLSEKEQKALSKYAFWQEEYVSVAGPGCSGSCGGCTVS